MTQMSFDPATHHRRSVRLPGYDYAQPGAYFLTAVVQGREPLFGDVVDGEMRLNEYGRMVREEWLRTEAIRAEIVLDVFVVMPNHLHGIVLFGDGNPVGAHGHAPLRRPSRSLGSLIGGFKSAATRRINEMRGSPGAPVWQRNYYEHVIRSERDLEAIRQYILNNPSEWADDPENAFLRETSLRQ